MTNDDTPATRFDRYIAEVERNLPERYRNPGRSKSFRPLNPWTVAPPIGLAVVAIGLVVGWWMGWPKG